MKKVVPLSVSMKEIQEYVLRIAQTFKPQKVILFGSYAHGKPQEARDVDILEVMDTPLRFTEQAIQIRKTIRAPSPLDLIVRTPQEIKNRLLMGDFFIKEIFSKGKVLYEASDQRVD